MTEPIRSMPELISALRTRAQTLGLAYGTVDAIAGLPDRYTSKLFAPVPIKNLGPISFEAILGALGVTVILVEDQEQCDRVSGRWTQRKRPLKTTGSIPGSIECEVPMTLQVTPELQRVLNKSDFMRKISARGNLARKNKLSPWKRRMIARRAAKARWARRAEHHA
jgi:hypothetical protein